MKQIIQSYKTGKINLEEVAVPVCRAGCVIVKNVCSAVSVGTEKLMIDTAKKSLVGKAMARPDLVRLAYEKAKREGFVSVFKQSMNRLDEPVPLGYSSAGIVSEVGDGVKEFKVGDKVTCAGAGFASHAEYICVPEEFCVKIPENVDFESASFNMIGAIAVNGVRQANLTENKNVAVIGLGLIGLITVQILKAEGHRVVGIDISKERVKLDKELGTDLVLTVGEDDVLSSVENFTKGNGVNAVIITAGSKDNKPILMAENICGRKGKIVLVGMADLKLTRKIFWEKELEFTVSKAAGPEKGDGDGTQRKNIEYFLGLLSSGRVRLDRLITHRFDINDALKCYEMILKNREPYVGVVFGYGDKGEILRCAQNDNTSDVIRPLQYHEILHPPRRVQNDKGETSVGVIGGGLFAKNILVPALKKVKNINFKGIATTKGITSNHIAKKFGFGYATTNYKEILNDKEIDSVFIITPHNMHARMAVEALKADKNVFVEKPLCIFEEELKEIVKAYNTSSKKLMVGFNRRFSPLAEKAKSFIGNRITPLVMNYRVNAGYIPEEHWTQKAEIGGGRIIGEVCHFIDFFQFLTNSYPETVFAESIGGSTGKYLENDNVCITVRFKDGSVGNIVYTAEGSKTFSRERIEIFCEDSVVVLDDFRKVELIRGAKKKTIKKFGQDMGYKGELEEFLSLQDKDDKLFEGYVYTTLATFRAVESLKKGSVEKIEIFHPPWYASANSE